MSGYGGRPPGWNDPYGQQGQGGWDSYGQQGQAGLDSYGQYGAYEQQGYEYDYGYGYGPPGVPYGRADNSSAIAALCCNIAATVLCCNVLCFAGIVTAAIAIGKTATEPQTSRKLVLTSWAILGGALLLEIVLVVLVMAVDAGSSNDSSYGTGGV